MELPVEVIVCLLMSLLMSGVDGVRVHYLHWNSTNPIFRIDNTDHIMDVNQGNLPWEYDQLNIICPAYQRGTRHTDSAEKYIIYNVSKEEYDSCRISQHDPRVVAVCDKPERDLQFTITFRSFSPTPRGLEFHPGQDYYFISTSSRRDIHRRVGGSCSTNNMKVMFKVAKNREEKKPAINVPRSLSTSSPDFSSPPYRSDLTEEEYKDMVRPIEDVRSFHSGLDQITKERYDRDQNSVVKQEASTMSRTSRTIDSVFLVIICALTALFRAVRCC